jgi:hypothetical protein
MTRRRQRLAGAEPRDSLISVGDVVVALKRLRPKNARTRARLLDVLGFADAPARLPRKRTRRAPLPILTPPLPPSNPHPGPAGHGGPTRERLQPVRMEPPQTGTEATATLSTDIGRVSRPVLPAPLFDPRWTRDIIVNVLSTRAPLGDYDIEALLALLAGAKPIVDIPRQNIRTLSRGAHLLVDIGESMEPFAADQERLVGDIKRIVGHDLVDVLSFRRTPAHGCGSGPLWTWKPYQRPRVLLPLVAISDLGLGGPPVSVDRGSEADWAAFFDSLPAQLPVVILNPYPSRRWPAALRRRVVILQWDRVTSPRLAWLIQAARGRRR